MSEVVPIKRLATKKPNQPPTIPTPRATPDPIDPHGQYSRAVKFLANDLGIDKQQLADEFWWRACCRWYAGDELGVAEALALQDIEERYERRRAA